MIDILAPMVLAHWPDTAERQRELEIIRARFAGGLTLADLVREYPGVPVELLVAICQRPMVLG